MFIEGCDWGLASGELRWFAGAAPRGSGLSAFLFGSAFGANLAHGSVDDALQFVRVGFGVAHLDVLNGAIKHALGFTTLDT